MTNPVLAQVIRDLREEGDELDAFVAGLDGEGWRTPTPAAGWNVATQIAHLAWTDAAAVSAATDADAWAALVAEAMQDPEHAVDAAALRWADVPHAELLARWRRGRSRLVEVLLATPPGTKLPWYGPPMSPTSMATARLMETWAHGIDVHQALGCPPKATDRIRHVAHLAVRTRDFAFVSRGLTPPSAEFRIEVTAPSGALWTWGPDDAAQRVTGSALDLCLLATQRIHRDDTALSAVGRDAEQWLGIAQCFAGPAGSGREKKA